MKTKSKTLLLSLFLSIPLLAHSQTADTFNGIQIGDSFKTVLPLAEDISKKTMSVDIVKPSFPLAEKSERHIICSTVNTQTGVLQKVAFTFADDKLVYIEARGNAYKTFMNQRKDTAMTYMDYEVFFSDKLFLNKKEDIVWILSEEALHPNLFAWKNPYMDDEVAESSKVPDIPAYLKTGVSLEELQPVLEANSDFTALQELDGSDPNAQVQLNAFGIEALGFPRKIEARFGDGKLNVVWILTGKGEEDRVRQRLIAQFGDPIYVNDTWEIFNDWQVGLRKDKPEVLLITQELGLQYKESYFKQ